MTAPGSRLLKEYRRGLLLLLPILIVGALLVVSSARWKGARRMDAIHRALSSVDGPLSDCARFTRSGFSIGGPEATIFISTGLVRLPAWTRNIRGKRGCDSWMVFGPKRRLFWPSLLHSTCGAAFCSHSPAGCVGC